LKITKIEPIFSNGPRTDSNYYEYLKTTLNYGATRSHPCYHYHALRAVRRPDALVCGTTLSLYALGYSKDCLPVFSTTYSTFLSPLKPIFAINLKLFSAASVHEGKLYLSNMLYYISGRSSVLNALTLGFISAHISVFPAPTLQRSCLHLRHGQQTPLSCT